MDGVNILAVNAVELLTTYLVTDWKRNRWNSTGNSRKSLRLMQFYIPCIFLCFVRWLSC